MAEERTRSAERAGDSHRTKTLDMGYVVGEDGLSIQDAASLDASTLTPLTPEVISRQATINIGASLAEIEPVAPKSTFGFQGLGLKTATPTAPSFASRPVLR